MIAAADASGVAARIVVVAVILAAAGANQCFVAQEAPDTRDLGEKRVECIV